MGTPIAPDLQVLLAEVPSAGTLLRVTPEQLIQGLRGTINRARPTTTGLLPVEAHLLAVHREELAHVLLEECVLRLYEDDTAHYRINWTSTPTPTRNEERVERALEHGASLLPEIALGREEATFPLAHLTPGQLAHLAMRIAPSVRGRTIQALECSLLRGQPKAAIRILRALVYPHGRSQTFGSQRDNLSLLLENEGQIEEAISILEPALSFPTCTVGYNLMIFGLEIGDADLACSGAQAVNAWYESRPEDAEFELRERSTSFANGQWIVFGECIETARRVETRFQGLARRFIDVLLN